MNTLKRLKIEDNTIIVFSSDNGPLIHKDEELENCYGKSGFTDPSREHVLRGGKYQERYDGGIRVSCIMTWPNTIPAGSTCNEPVTAMDLFTTFANVAGAEIPTDRAIDGKDIQALMRQDEDAVSPDKAIYGYRARGGLMSVRYKNWKLVFKNKFNPEVDNELYLYDLNNDLKESRDVASE